jgi:hypothetical protein
MKRINTTTIGQVGIIGHPNICPFCHRSITPNIVSGHKSSKVLEVFMWCPDKKCEKSFIGFYTGGFDKWEFNGDTTKGNIIAKEIKDTINDISHSFALIYNQAFYAEQNGLTEICGVGYRKALEFLIKDYLILNNPDQKDKIEKKLLGPCIDQYISDSRIKSVAKRAAWLGNDETHYIRKWEGKNMDDLKKLIELTIHWIEMEELTKSFNDEMPEL